MIFSIYSLVACNLSVVFLDCDIFGDQNSTIVIELYSVLTFSPLVFHACFHTLPVMFSICVFHGNILNATRPYIVYCLPDEDVIDDWTTIMRVSVSTV